MPSALSLTANYGMGSGTSEAAKNEIHYVLVLKPIYSIGRLMKYRILKHGLDLNVDISFLSFSSTAHLLRIRRAAAMYTLSNFSPS
jgi:hypothetical protein